MVKNTPSARDYRAMCRQVRQLKKNLAEKERKHRLFQNEVLSAEKEYEKRMNLERETSSILRHSMKNFSRSLYKIKAENKKLFHDNTRLSNAAKRHKTINERLSRGLEQLKALRKNKKKRKASWAQLEKRLIKI